MVPTFIVYLASDEGGSRLSVDTTSRSSRRPLRTRDGREGTGQESRRRIMLEITLTWVDGGGGQVGGVLLYSFGVFCCLRLLGGNRVRGCVFLFREKGSS